MNSIATKTISTNVFRERSWTSVVEELGSQQVSMEIYECDDPGLWLVECYASEIDEGWQIGIWFNTVTKELTDYDGVFSLSPDVALFLEEQGLTIGEDFR
jgi:hypothetical protein